MASSQVIYHAKSLNSTVYRLHKPAVRPDSDALVALKIVRLSSQQAPHDVVKETQVMRRLGNHHPYIMPLLGSGEMAGGLYVLRMPYMRYDLSSIARQNVLSANQKQFLLHNMFSGLAAVHRMGIIHRDIKPSNILLHHISGPAYLSDFGISWHEAINTEEAANNKITDVGTGCYRAPELLFGCRSYGAGLDMWAAGCTMAEVLVGGGKTLFDAGPTSREDFLGSDLGLIGSMFRTRGTPTDETWPEAKTFRDWGKISFKDYPALPWPEILPGVNIGGRDVVAGLVVYESADRSSAEGVSINSRLVATQLANIFQVLKQPYFQAYDAAGH